MQLKIGRQDKRIRTQNFVSACCAAAYMEPNALGWVPLGSANLDASGQQPMASRKNDGMPLKCCKNKEIQKTGCHLLYPAFHFSIAEINALGWFGDLANQPSKRD